MGCLRSCHLAQVQTRTQAVRIWCVTVPAPSLHYLQREQAMGDLRAVALVLHQSVILVLTPVATLVVVLAD